MRRLLALLTLGAALMPAPAAAAVPVLVIEGRGFGHGVGMAQDGAYWMGRRGARTEQILSHFYPGTTLGRRGGGVRVPVLEGVAATTLEFPDGGEVRDAAGGASVLAVPRGGRVRFRLDGSRHRAVLEPSGRALPAPGGGGMRLIASRSDPDPATTTTTAPQGLLPGLLNPTLPSLPTTTVTTAPPPGDDRAPADEEPGQSGGAGAASARPLWAVPAGGGVVGVPDRGRRYRGAVEVGGGPGSLRLVNQLDVEQYLKGMGEVRDPSWPPAALRAQAVVARTYALRAMAGAGEVCETQRCQVYLGAQAEYGAMSKAVDATRGQVVMFRGNLASTVYSANGGGHSATSEEGFGTPAGDYPYLRALPYETEAPDSWAVRVALGELRRRLGYRGSLTDVAVSRTGPSGRVLEVVLQGSSGPRAVPGIEFDAALGLRSTLFSLRTEEAASAPPPLEGGDLLQAPPDQLGSLGLPAEQLAVDVGAAAPAGAAGAPTVVDAGRARQWPLGPVLLAFLLLARVGRRTSRVARATAGTGRGRAPEEPAVAR